jgi:hypothetical protein
VTIALLIITDGRDDYLTRCVNSISCLAGDITERWMHDDTGDTAYRAELAREYPTWNHLDAGPRVGCAGAFQSAWSKVKTGTSAKFFFLIEQDFVFNRPIDLDQMASLLDDRPYLAQVALRRQPWNDVELAAGGVVESHPDWYVDMEDDHGRQWLEQGFFYTTNPSLQRVTLLDVPWPAHQEGRYSEGAFHQRLLADGTSEVSGDQVRYAYWGSRDSGEWCEHIGRLRVGMGY